MDSVVIHGSLGQREVLVDLAVEGRTDTSTRILEAIYILYTGQ